jgi:hypothetical protein
MHEPSSRPFARREHNNVVRRKTVSLEGIVQGFKVSKFPTKALAGAILGFGQSVVVAVPGAAFGLFDEQLVQ